VANCDALHHALDSKEEVERLSAAIKLGRAGHLEPLLSDLKSKAAEGRRRYLSGADSWTEGDGTEPPAWPDGFYGRRWLVGSAHAGLAAGGRAAAVAVGELLQAGAEPWWVRAAAAQALAEMGREAAVVSPILRAALGDEEEWVAIAAAEALGCVGPTADGANEEALAHAVLEPPSGRRRRWPLHGDSFRTKWPLVALAKLAGQPGFRKVPPEAREAVVRALASEARRDSHDANERNEESKRESIAPRSGAAWWAELGLRRAAGAAQESPGSWF